MVGKPENILVEFDYNNITIIDPNKVVDSNDKVLDRYVNQEDLVMYANLECSVLPRTKLAIGVGNNDSIRTISIAKINFLKPGDKAYLDNSYTDEITGKGALKGEGVNQPTFKGITNPNNSDDFYIKQTISSGGKPGSTDNGLLGITSINIRQGLDFMPTIDIKLVDVKGRALFEAGDNSPYAAFFNLPYPLFYLTIKGYFGKAVKLALMLQNFTTTYNAETSNFTVDLKFYTYKYTVLTDITMGALLATPHMYQSRFNISKTSGGPSKTTQTENVVVERGYQKIREMYSEYKSKGLIPDDFPEITLMQMKNRLENFIKNILDSFIKQNLDPLTNLETYGTYLFNYQKEVFYNVKTSWFNEFMDTENYYIKNKTGQKIYTFKKNLDSQKKSEAISKLKGLIDKYNKLLNENVTCGNVDGKGSYTINGKVTKCSIPNSIKYETQGVFVININPSDIDLVETYKLQKKNSQPTPEDLTKFQAELQNSNKFDNTTLTLKNGAKQVVSNYFVFEGTGSFIDFTDKMNKDLKTWRDKIEDELTKALSLLLENKDNGIGFVPTIRNVLAVVFANGEAFLRLLDDVHTKAWDQRDSKIRKGVIFNKQIANASADSKDSGDDKNQPVYPWPQVIKETPGENGQEKYELRYPGDSDIIGETKGYLYDVWPEIEFVEEFIKGMTQKTPPPPPPTKTSNPGTEPNRVSSSAIEFPISDDVYANKVVSKYLYEIYERTLLTSNYTKLDRVNNLTSDADKISNVIAEGESNNINISVSDNSDVELIKTLKEYNLTSANFENVLKHISNEGVSISWQNYIRGIFNTPYIKNIVENASFEFIYSETINSSKSQPLVSVTSEKDIIDYVSNSTTSNKYDFTDTYPFTDKTWVQTGLANGVATDEKLAFNTTKTLLYNPTKKVITNFSDSQSEDVKKPITNFVYKNVVMPIIIDDDLRNFYSTRTYTNQLPTEGDVKYLNYTGLVSNYQTTSILNTPYFINSIQEGVENSKNSVKNPYISSAYLFINSLPLSTLREKYKTYNGNQSNYSDESLDYIFASMKKFAALHKVPYAWVLKIGSIWHRYKTYVNTNVDILNNCWKDFDYVTNYDPVSGKTSTVYNFTIPGQTSATTMVLESVDVIPSYPIGATSVQTIINTGFYPKLINDFSVFYQGYNIYTGYTSSDIQNGFSKGVKLNYVPEAVINNVVGTTTGNSKTISVIPWSVSLTTDYGQYSYVVPSHGGLINQTKNECFDNLDNIVYQVTGNTSMYNGSVRLFWPAPNYGYFDNSKVVKPDPIRYLKQVFASQSSQENFSINGVLTDYTKMSEIFSVFDRDALDNFESEFLKFTISVYDFDVDKNSTETDTQKSFKNFQSLMRTMMKVTNTTTNDNQFVSDVQSKQLIGISNIITQFLNYDVYFKLGNPSSFNKQLFYTFSNNHFIETPVTWDYYNYNTPNALPSGTTYINSVNNFPLEWKALDTYVGFSEIPELSYKDGGSYITDFFIDCNVAFDVYNIEKLAPIIKIYATQKLKDNTLNYQKFVKLMNGYLDNLDSFTDRVINSLMIKLQKSLPNVNFTPQPEPKTILESKQTKLELWESFKATNDKWISGFDFKQKTLFEDVLLMDRASRDIGNLILVDVEKLKDNLTNINVQTTMLTYVQTILVENNFVVMNIPSYVNFYNVQDAVKNPKPKPEGTLEFANTLFGTFMNVDTRNSSAKMVCFYAGKPSEQPDIKENVDFRYRNDAFDLRRVDNPLVENQIGKNDWDKSNKVVGFNVDFGPQNQSIFQGFNVAQNPGLATAESLEVLNQMANQANNRGGATQNNSLYNLYKNRSYACTVTMMGNAMIQPTMYFNLRHVPMFSGPYMIQKVNHTISPGHFDTVFEGIRQPTASLPKIDNYLQSLKTTLLKSIQEKNKKDRIEKEKAVKSTTATTTNTSVQKQVTNKVDESTKKDGTTQSNSQNCKPKEAKQDKYGKFTVTNDKVSSSATYKEVIDLISSKTTDQKIRYSVFAKMYLSSSQSGMLQSQSNNYSGTDLLQDWGPSVEVFFTTKKYYCSDSNTPYVTFNSLNQNIDFLISRYEKRVGNIATISATDIAKFIILNSDAGIPTSDSVYTSMSTTDIKTIESNVQNAINIYNPTSGNVTGVVPPANPPAPTTPTTNTDSVVFENSRVFDTYFLQNLTTNSDGSISGDFLVINQGQTLSQDYPAKLYVASTTAPIELDTFIIGKNNRGTFKTQPDTVNSLKTIQNRQTFEIDLIVRVDSFPKISYVFTQVLLPIGCPDLGWKTNDLIEVGDWDAIKDNICCECYSKPYTGTQVSWKDQTCSKNGTPPC
jgi:hypothetical protein